MINRENLPNLAGVYKLTNLINGKVYIGKSWNIRRRLSGHIHCSNSSSRERLEYVHLAIKKHGTDNFRADVLEAFPGDGEAFNWLLLDREAFWIRIYDSCNREKGYNLSEYGTSKLNYKTSEETRRKLSKANKGKIISESTRRLISIAMTGSKHPLYGKPKSEETKRKIREANTGRVFSDERKKRMSEERKGKRTGQESHKFGTKASEETKQKQREASRRVFENNPGAKQGFLNCSKKAILKIDIETGEILEEFASIKEAAIKLVGDVKLKRPICECLYGRIEIAFGFSWRFKNPNDSSRKRASRKLLKVNQIDLITREVIKTWDSIAEVVQELGASRTGVSRCFSGKAQSCVGFFWEKLEKAC